LIGDHGFQGIAAAANEPGSDGVVRVASANLHCAKMQVDFNQQPSYTLQTSRGLTAFGVLEGENHHTIVGKENGFKNANTMESIIKALTVSDEHFSDWCQQLKQNNHTGCFQQIIYRVKDQYHYPVTDYFVEFYQPEHDRQAFETFFHEEVIKHVHNYEADPSYRNVYIDCYQLHQEMAVEIQKIHMSLTAYPDLSQEGNVVGYRTHGDKTKAAIVLDRERLVDIFQTNSSLLVEITLQREQKERLFEFDASKRW